MSVHDEATALFNDLYEAHSRALYAYLLGRTGDRHRADDLLQETFVRVWRRLGSVQDVPAERRRYWLFRVAHNVHIDDVRRQRARPQTPLPAEQIEERTAAVAPHADVERIMDLDAAVARLPEPLRMVVTMRYAGGMTSNEIGEALGRPAGTIRYQLTTARKRLAVLLTPTEEGIARAGDTRYDTPLTAREDG